MALLFQMLTLKLSLLTHTARRRLRLVCWALTMPPIAGAAPDEDDDDADKPDADEADKPDADADDDDADKPDADEADKPPAVEPDWKRMARKHEREAKKARREREDLERKLKAREDQDKSEQEKAIEQAQQQARQEVEGKYDKERRNDRLEVETTKLAARGLKIGTGDAAKTVRFADPDDALLHLQRDINNGDLDVEDVFDEKGKVKTDALTEALSEILTRKPHLAADTGKSRKVDGGADGGRGGPANTDVTAESELNKIRRHSSERPDQGARFRRAA